MKIKAYPTNNPTPKRAWDWAALHHAADVLALPPPVEREPQKRERCAALWNVRRALEMCGEPT